uniref:Uncharacterized protein n=1 Tax=Rhizophora mucronata TaxID=61149 RepID=A0A2P2KDE5_RHIMU
MVNYRGSLGKRRKRSCRCFHVEKRFKTSKLEAKVLKYYHGIPLRHYT